MEKYLILSSMMISLLVSGCGITGMITDQRELQEVNVQLKYFHQAQFAGNYVAEEKGFYSDKGLDVKFLNYSFDKAPIEKVADGSADFGIAGADEILLARAKGIPVKAFASIYKISPACIFYLKSSQIAGPLDFAGKKIGIGGSEDVRFAYRAMLKKLGINKSLIDEIYLDSPSYYTSVIDGTVDASMGYLMNEPYYVYLSDQEADTFLMAEYGINTYSDVLFASEDTIENNPELVGNFLQATLEGWRYAIENDEEALDIVMLYAENVSEEHQEFMLSGSVPFIHTGKSHIGWMDISSWEEAEDIILSIGELKANISVHEAYTVEFLEKIYEGQD